jgi:hypothetical protein
VTGDDCLLSINIETKWWEPYHFLLAGSQEVPDSTSSYRADSGNQSYSRIW